MDTIRRTKRNLAIVILFLIFTFEGLYLPLLYTLGVNKFVIESLLYLKYIIVLVIIVKFFFSADHKKNTKLEPLLIATVIAIVLVLFVAEMTIPKLSLSVVTVELFPLLTYIAGRYTAISEATMLKTIKWITGVSVIICVYAILDVKFLDERFWLALRQGKYLTDIKNYNPNQTIYGLIGNFFYDPFGEKIRRAVGTQGDPLAFSYSMVLPLTIVITYRKKLFRYSKVFIIVIAAAIVASLTRAIILTTFFTLVLDYFFKKRHIIIIYLTSISGILIIGLLGDKTAKLLSLSDSSTFGHVGSLSSALSMGVATFLFGNLFTGTTSFYNYESGFLTILVNYGIIITFIFYYFIYQVIIKLYRGATPLHRALALTGSIGVFTSIVFSQSFFSFTGFGMFWLLSGIAVTYNNSINGKKTLHRRYLASR